MTLFTLLSHIHTNYFFYSFTLTHTLMTASALRICKNNTTHKLGKRTWMSVELRNLLMSLTVGKSLRFMCLYCLISEFKHKLHLKGVWFLCTGEFPLDQKKFSYFRFSTVNAGSDMTQNILRREIIFLHVTRISTSDDRKKLLLVSSRLQIRTWFTG